VLKHLREDPRSWVEAILMVGLALLLIHWLSQLLRQLPALSLTANGLEGEVRVEEAAASSGDAAAVPAVGDPSPPPSTKMKQH
jgi:hypothetical protein